MQPGWTPPLQPVRAQGIFTIGIWSEPYSSSYIADQNLAPGQTFSFSVVANEAPDFDTYTLRIEYNPYVVSFLSSSFEDTLLSPNLRLSLVAQEGKEWITVFATGQQSSGTGALVYLTFRIESVGFTLLRISESTVSLQGNAIPHQLLEGCFRNNDGQRIATADFAKDPAPSFNETSLYFMGAIGVSVVFPESEGHEYDWTDEELNQAIAQVKSALEWWASLDPRAKISVEYEFSVRVPTTYEPALREWADTVWISNVMTSLGYAPATSYVDVFDQVRAHNNDVRQRLGTDWAFTMFIFDSSGPGAYVRQTPHAYLGGPWLAMGGDQLGAFERIVSHEIGHIFFATDEYNGFQEQMGYLRASDVETSGALMDNSTPSRISAGTRAQIGWADCDGNGKLDIIDTYPSVRIAPVPPRITSFPLLVNGTALDVAYPSYGTGSWNSPIRSVTTNKIARIEYQVNAGAWVNATASDGAVDEALENFHLQLSSLPEGRPRISVRVVNTAGNSIMTTFTLTVTGPFGFDWADFNNDATADLDDMDHAASCFDKKSGSRGWSDCSYWDLDLDDGVRIVDLAFAAALYRVSSEPPFPGEGQPPGTMDRAWSRTCSTLGPPYLQYCESRLS